MITLCEEMEELGKNSSHTKTAQKTGKSETDRYGKKTEEFADGIAS